MSDTAHSLLVNVLASPRGGLISDNNQYRRYTSAVRTWTSLANRDDNRYTSITYEIGRASDSSRRLLAPPGAQVPRIDTSYDVNAAEVELFTSLGRKYSNFSGSFMRASLGGVVERLACALATHSLFGDVTTDRIAAGMPLRVSALGAHDTPVTSLTNSVFIPRVVESQVTQDTWSVLVHAVAGEGSAVVTDILNLDAATRQPILPAVDRNEIANPIVSALQLLGANMNSSNQGTLFALSVTRGLHTALSVVGHTDEGGITRDLLRCARQSAPFGGINPNPAPYVGLPSLASTRPADISGYVDSIALVTAGAVAHCDPGQWHDGVWFPQFFSALADTPRLLRPGEGEEVQGAGPQLRAQVVASVSQFSELYCRALGTIFGCRGDVLHAAGFMSASAHSLPADPRHLRYASVTPWYWIEPTSLLPTNLIGSEAEACGSGALGEVAMPTEVPGFEAIQPVGNGDLLRSYWKAFFPSARRSGLLLHFWGHPLDGVATVIPRQLDVSGIIQPGAGPVGTPDQVRDRLEDGLPLSDYLWTRGQSPFPAPGEFLNLGANMGFLLKHVSMDAAGGYREEHMYNSGEVMGARVSILAARPMGIDTAQSNAGSRDSRRARTKAAVSLANARRRLGIFGTNDAGEMPISFGPPSGGPPPPLERHSGQSGGGVGRPVQLRPGPEHSSVTQAVGEPKVVTYQHGATTGPRPGGGGAPGAPGPHHPPAQVPQAPAAPPAGPPEGENGPAPPNGAPPT